MFQAKPLYKILASSVGARLNCLADEKRTGKTHEWTEKHAEAIEKNVKNFLPHGSGIDSDIVFDFYKSNAEKLVFHFSFHHMNENGFYDGWTDHTLTVKPSLQFDIDLSISGRNRNDIKEYLHQTFSAALVDLIDYDQEKKCYFSISMRAAQQAYQARLAEEK